MVWQVGAVRVCETDCCEARIQTRRRIAASGRVLTPTAAPCLLGEEVFLAQLCQRAELLNDAFQVPLAANIVCAYLQVRTNTATANKTRSPSGGFIQS